MTREYSRRAARRFTVLYYCTLSPFHVLLRVVRFGTVLAVFCVRRAFSCAAPTTSAIAAATSGTKKVAARPPTPAADALLTRQARLLLT